MVGANSNYVWNSNLSPVSLQLYFFAFAYNFKFLGLKRHIFLVLTFLYLLYFEINP